MELIFNMSSKVMLWPDVSKEAGALLKEQNIDRVMVVYDPGLEGLGIVEGVMASIKDNGITAFTFNGVQSDPSYKTVNDLAQTCKEKQVEGIVGIGGGSAMDTAKCANILLENPGTILDYAVVYDTVNRKGKYLILIPTTFGTASEITDGGVLTVPENNKKVTVWGKNIGGDLALVDPNIAVGLPPAITAGTGMDALAHAVESYFTILATPMTDAVAIKAIDLITNNLPICYKDGDNLEARTNMCIGCLLAGMAFNNAFLCQGHNLAHVLGAKFHVPHGIACALSLPLVIKSNVKIVPKRMSEIAKAFGIEHGEGSTDISERLESAIKGMCEEMHIPVLSDFGISKNDFEMLATAFDEEPDKEYFLYVPTHNEVIDYLKEIYK